MTRSLSAIAALALLPGCASTSAPAGNREVANIAPTTRPYADLIGTRVEFVSHGELEPETASVPAGFSTDDIVDFPDNMRAIGASGSSSYLVILTRNNVVIDVAEMREPVAISATCSRSDGMAVLGVVAKDCAPGKADAVRAWEVRNGRLEPLQGITCKCLIDL